MYFFDKKTMYLVWSMQEGQARGVGTVKFLVVDEICRIEISITSCGKVQGTYPVYLQSGGMKSLLGEIVLNKGRGNLYLKCSTESLGHKMFSYRQVTGLHIDLKTEGVLEQKWLPMQPEIKKSEPEAKTSVTKSLEAKVSEARVPEAKTSEIKNVMTKMPEVTTCEVRVSETEAEEKVWKPKALRSEKVDQEEIKQENQEQVKLERVKAKAVEEGKLQAQIGYQEIVALQSSNDPIKKAPDEVKPPEKNTMALYPSKWQQLCAIYPVVHPFQDGRAYLSIEPRDFVVLQERYQPMVQNSFLLHGFYHYRHLLLGRMKQGKSIQYYLGVPGVFYEKEKAAALFYGFESFEGAETPSKEGSFGYYMKRVQI